MNGLIALGLFSLARAAVAGQNSPGSSLLGTKVGGGMSLNDLPLG